MALSDLLADPQILRWHEEVAELFDSSGDQTLPGRLSETVKKIVRHEAYILKLYRPRDDLPVILSHDIPAHLHEIYFNRYLSYAYLEDPLLPRVQDGRTRIVQINPYTCPLKNSGYYRTYYKDLPLQDEVDLIFPMNNGDSLVLSIAKREGITSEQEIAALANATALVRSLLSTYHRAHLDAPRPVAGDDPLEGMLFDKILTAREIQIVGLMVSGKGTKEIARLLEISIQTVKVHRRNIYSKLGISTELQLCSMFLSAQTTQAHPEAHPCRRG